MKTGQEALGLIQTRHYDFVFTDLRMPAMDGVEVAKSVKHMRPDIDVIIITGFATVETAVECMKSGAMDYVQKPFTEDELRAFVRKALIKRKDQIEKRLQPQGPHHAGGRGERRARRASFPFPAGCLISKGHCWASLSQDGSVRVGMDDFAKKLIGRVDAVELPSVDMALQAGQPLFAIRQGARRIQFLAPVSGRVAKVNHGLSEMKQGAGCEPYHSRWVCEIAGDKLGAEIPALKIGSSAVALFQEDIGRFSGFDARSAQVGESGRGCGSRSVHRRAGGVNDEQWNRLAKDFFGRSE